MSGGCPTRKREHKLQPGLLEPCALKGARTVLRGRGSGDTSSLPDNPRANRGNELIQRLAAGMAWIDTGERFRA